VGRRGAARPAPRGETGPRGPKPGRRTGARRQGGAGSHILGFLGIGETRVGGKNKTRKGGTLGDWGVSYGGGDAVWDNSIKVFSGPRALGMPNPLATIFWVLIRFRLGGPVPVAVRGGGGDGGPAEVSSGPGGGNGTKTKGFFPWATDRIGDFSEGWGNGAKGFGRGDPKNWGESSAGGEIVLQIFRPKGLLGQGGPLVIGGRLGGAVSPKKIPNCINVSDFACFFSTFADVFWAIKLGNDFEKPQRGGAWFGGTFGGGVVGEATGAKTGVQWGAGGRGGPPQTFPHQTQGPEINRGRVSSVRDLRFFSGLPKGLFVSPPGSNPARGPPGPLRESKNR